jgi:hypothetical protein
MKKLIITSAITICFFLCASLITNAQNVYEVKFSISRIPYRGALLIWNDGSAKMRVRYYLDGEMKMVEESMTVESILGTPTLVGYDPVYPGTDISYPHYSADNFLITHNLYGETEITTVDGNFNVADVSSSKVSGYYEKQSFLSDFNWRL